LLQVVADCYIANADGSADSQWEAWHETENKHAGFSVILL
jgi:hypothetical protein